MALGTLPSTPSRFFQDQGVPLTARGSMRLGARNTAGFLCIEHGVTARRNDYIPESERDGGGEIPGDFGL